MEIRKWTTVDVYYTDNETVYANNERKRLERLGYQYQHTDIADELRYIDQYIKNGKTRITGASSQPQQSQFKPNHNDTRHTTR